MTFGLIMTATLLASLLAGAQQRQSDPEAQLVAAIHEEMVAGNPASAIEQYKSIVTQNGVSRAVAAAALLRIGECQEKLGRSEEARATYLRLIKQYGDQSGVAAQAREQLENVPTQADEDAATSCAAGAGPCYGLGTAAFPVSVAAGKHVKYSGYIKTEGINRGWAGLWWRVDGEPGTPALAFDNMQDRGATGTTPWTRYEIDLDVPANATHVYFGVLHVGNGDAWFDTLQVELNGVAYTDRTHFDLDFESSPPRGFYTGGKGYKVEVDEQVAHTGKQSLRSHFIGTHKAQAEKLH
jgi:tetratricopeptide (TPR) repeat protein